MADINIFEYYGIKEVANVYFEALSDDENWKAGDIALYLDTLKVSNIEQTASNTSAQGGWGNPKLITWDYGKDINLTLEDAVVSMESLRMMLGGKLRQATTAAPVTVYRTEDQVFKSGDTFEGFTPEGATQAVTVYKWINMTAGTRGQKTATAGTAPITGEALTEDTRVRFFWTEEKTGQTDDGAVEITITPNDWPGTFKVIGDALIRDKNGADHAFQFKINRAKMLSEVTLQMQAEGDPSTFNMTLNVMRDDDGNMMSLTRY